MKLNRIAILGCPGSGKTELALKLGKILNLPVYHLDKDFRTRTYDDIDYDDVRRRMYKLVSQEKWIADGNYNKTANIRIDNADLVIYFMYPTEICLKRAKKRFEETKGIQRFDEPIGMIDYEFDQSFENYIINFHKTYDRVYISYLTKKNKQYVILHNDEEVINFINSINKQIPICS